MKTYKNIHDAYLETLRDVYFNYEYRSAPRGLPVREKTDYSFRILEPVAEAIRTLDMLRNSTISEYTRKEVELYNSCTNQVADFAKASKFWEKLANPDGTVNSAYGHLIWEKKSCGNHQFELHKPDGKRVPAFSAGKEFIESKDACYRTPWEWAKHSLVTDKDSRQAIMRFSLPEHQWAGNKDQTCTMHANFLIRDDKLNLSVVMRSNDLWLGLTYDLPWFISLIDRMVEELRPYYPNLTKGTYTHTVHSLHLYERDHVKILSALGINDVKCPNGQTEYFND
jgi:thymidylate synthase